MTWFAMVVIGFSLMYAMKFTPPLIDFILVRLAAASFVGGGTIGATGWIGNMFDGLFGWIVSLADQLGNAAVGTGIVWLIATGVGGLWIGALLPGRVFKLDFPDWLVVGGFLLPGLLSAIPGATGALMSDVILWVGNSMNDAVSGIF